jgi:hypothetical protein
VILLLVGCAAIYNQAPRFASVAGVDVKKDVFSGDYEAKEPIVVDLGEPFDVEVRDPEGRDVAIWVPFAPAGVEVDSSGHTITIGDAGDLTASVFGLDIIAEDSSPDPQSALCFVSGWIAGTDTGFVYDTR